MHSEFKIEDLKKRHYMRDKGEESMVTLKQIFKT
jgi:hypothetical protein